MESNAGADARIRQADVWADRLKKGLLYCFAFCYIYTPNLSVYGISTKLYLLLDAAAIALLLLFLRKEGGALLGKRQVRVLWAGLWAATAYAAVIIFCYNFEQAIDYDVLTDLIKKNLFVLPGGLFLAAALKRLYHGLEACLRFLLNVALLQSVLCLFMFLFPSLREIAVAVYRSYAINETITQGILPYRVYGLTMDFTFTAPIFHGLASALALLLAIDRSWKYLLYLPFFVLAIFLNGRTGILGLVFALLAALLSGLWKQNRQQAKRLGKILPLLAVTCALGAAVVAALNDNSRKWILQGIQEIFSLFQKTEKGENVTTLTNMTHFPSGWAFWFGLGHRVFSYGAGNFMGMDIAQSDIGYVNDMYIGGVVFLMLLYLPWVYFLWKKRESGQWRWLERTFTYAMLALMLFGNYKGELIRVCNPFTAGLLVTIFLFLLFEPEKDAGRWRHADGFCLNASV